MKDGAFERDFQEALQGLIDDIWDPGKEPAGKRGFTLKFTHTARSREVGRLEMEISTIKMGRPLYPTVMGIQLDLEKGVAVAYERNSSEDGHAGLFDHDGDVSGDVKAQN
jgi:hypothetical protein